MNTKKELYLFFFKKGDINKKPIPIYTNVETRVSESAKPISKSNRKSPIAPNACFVFSILMSY